MKVDYQKQMQEIEQIYDDLSLHFNYFDKKSNGDCQYPLFNFSQCRQTEEFVVYVVSRKRPLLRSGLVMGDILGKKIFNHIPLPYFRESAPYDFIFNHQCSESSETLIWFNEQVKMMYEEYHRIGLLNFLVSNNYKSIDSLSIYQYQFVQDLVDRLRKEWGEKNRIAASKLNSAVNTRYSNYCDYIDDLFKLYKSLTFLCFDLTLSDQTEPKRLHEARGNFLNYGRSVQGMSDAVGYMGKWEWSLAKGFYFRVILVFPSECAKHPKSLCTLIADYWVEDITQGGGVCHEAKLTAKTPKFKNTWSTVENTDTKSITLFKERIVLYMTKSEKYFMPKILADFLDNKLSTVPQSFQMSVSQFPQDSVSGTQQKFPSRQSKPSVFQSQPGQEFFPQKIDKLNSGQQIEIGETVDGSEYNSNQQMARASVVPQQHVDRSITSTMTLGKPTSIAARPNSFLSMEELAVSKQQIAQEKVSPQPDSEDSASQNKVRKAHNLVYRGSIKINDVSVLES